MTGHILAHELRTPVNHIIGYSELLLDDLMDSSDSVERETVAAMHAIGMDLLKLTNATLAGVGSEASPEVLTTLRAGVKRHADRILTECLTPERLAGLQESPDVRRILDATRRLEEFARTGHIRTSETAA